MEILGSIDGAKDGPNQKDEDAALYAKSARELFESIDKDGDGFIGANELRNYLIGRLRLSECWATSRPRKRSSR